MTVMPTHLSGDVELGNVHLWTTVPLIYWYRIVDYPSQTLLSVSRGD